MFWIEKAAEVLAVVRLPTFRFDHGHSISGSRSSMFKPAFRYMAMIVSTPRCPAYPRIRGAHSISIASCAKPSHAFDASAKMANGFQGLFALSGNVEYA